MSRFRTSVEITPSSFSINYTTPIFCMGSCFAQNMGERLQQSAFNTLINPFGVLYNPASINNALEIITKQKAYTKNDIQNQNGIWFSFDHHSDFSHIEPETCLQNINAQIANSFSFLKNAQIAIITLGTSWVYKLKESKKIVSNCHKIPAKEFNRERLSVEETKQFIRQIAGNLVSINPDIKIIFTVSPIRHWKDGANGNQLSKATLLLALENFCQSNNIGYFPSYEIMLDELRDYRFYDKDMLHPNELAIDYIWEQFGKCYFNENTHNLMHQVDKFKKAAQHRTFFPDAQSHKDFKKQQLTKLGAFIEKYPFIDLSEEKKVFSDND